MPISDNIWQFLIVSGKQGQSRAESGYLWLSLSISGYLWLSLPISNNLWQFLAVSGNLGQSWENSGNLLLSLTISGYLELSLSNINHQGSSRSRREQVIAIWNFLVLNSFFLSRTSYRGARAPEIRPIWNMEGPWRAFFGQGYPKISLAGSICWSRRVQGGSLIHVNDL